MPTPDSPDGVKTDRDGRILDQRTGRPLRDKRSRPYDIRGLPFHGKAGKPHPGLSKLEARQKAFDADKDTRGRRRPGSLKKK